MSDGDTMGAKSHLSGHRRPLVGRGWVFSALVLMVPGCVPLGPQSSPPVPKTQFFAPTSGLETMIPLQLFVAASGKRLFSSGKIPRRSSFSRGAVEDDRGSGTSDETNR